jgi:hypothetical protein
VSLRGDPHDFFLRGPEQREIHPFGQGLGRELGKCHLYFCSDEMEHAPQPEAIGTVWTVARIQLVGCRVPDCAEAHLLQAIDESGRFEEALQRLATGSGEVRKGRVYTLLSLSRDVSGTR